VPAREAEATANVAGAIYGQLLATAVVATLSEDEEISAAETFSGVAVTVLVFWLAHVYAEGVAERLGRERGLGWPEVRSVAAREWPMAQAAVPTLVVLGLGWVGALSRDAAIDLAIVVGVAALVAWGFVIARRSRMSALGTVGAVALTGGLGLAIVVLKVAVH
jgi:hypothetical protein